VGVEQTLGHVPALRRYARLLTGDAQRADDLVQDTLERACLKWSLWQPESILRSWLLSIMHNLHANQRRDWRHDDGHADLDAAPEPTHEPMALAAERIDLQRALGALPLAMREVLLLVTVEEYTYAEAAVILVRMMGYPVEKNASYAFDDTQGNWAESDINTARRYHLISGVGDNRFAPDAPLTRQEIAVMLNNILGYTQVGQASAFDDVNADANSWSYEAINALTENGVISGYPDGTYKPQADISRAEMTTLISRTNIA
jgi:RNA polymerase sigma-70 factor (ECF subfamily)